VQPHFEYLVRFQLSHFKNMMEVVEIQKKATWSEGCDGFGAREDSVT